MEKKQLISGYIEGYFGRELTWPQRKDVISHLHRLGMNSYLYAPKEDPYHRVKWKTQYPEEWRQELEQLYAFGEKKGVGVIPALAPGLSYDYLADSDYQILLDKFKVYFDLGMTHVALLMDDIPDELPENCVGKYASLGEAHGLLLDKLLNDLKAMGEGVKLWFCPTIYTDQFVKGKAVDCNYIKDLHANMPEEITVMWTGNRVVSEELSEETCGEIVDLFGGNVLFWDNLYANDYTPLRIFLGAFEGREHTLVERSSGIMINPTGLLETDKFLLHQFSNFLFDNDVSEEKWVETAKEYGVPELFINIRKFFWLPFLEVTEDEYSEEKIASYGNLYDDLIVDWVHPLKMEWFTWLHALHLDFVYLGRDKDKLQPWVMHRYPPVISNIIGQ